MEYFSAIKKVRATTCINLKGIKSQKETSVGEATYYMIPFKLYSWKNKIIGTESRSVIVWGEKICL